MARERIFDKFADIPGDEREAEIHCAIKYVSPVKKARSGIQCFDSQVTDGNDVLSIVEFHENKQ